MEKNFYVFAIAARLDYRRPDLFDFEKPDFLIQNTYYTNDRADTNTKTVGYIIDKMMEPYNINGVGLSWIYECKREGKEWAFWIYQENDKENPIGR